MSNIRPRYVLWAGLAFSDVHGPVGSKPHSEETKEFLWAVREAQYGLRRDGLLWQTFSVSGHSIAGFGVLVHELPSAADYSDVAKRHPYPEGLEREAQDVLTRVRATIKELGGNPDKVRLWHYVDRYVPIPVSSD